MDRASRASGTAIFIASVLPPLTPFRQLAPPAGQNVHISQEIRPLRQLHLAGEVG